MADDSPLGQLPPELRNTIFELVFTSKTSYCRVGSHNGSGGITKPGILRTCRQFRYESWQLFFTTARFTATFDLGQVVNSVASRPPLVRALRRYVPREQRALLPHLDITFPHADRPKLTALAAILLLLHDSGLLRDNAVVLRFVRPEEEQEESRFTFASDWDEVGNVLTSLLEIGRTAAANTMLDRRVREKRVYEEPMTKEDEIPSSLQHGKLAILEAWKVHHLFHSPSFRRLREAEELGMDWRGIPDARGGQQP